MAGKLHARYDKSIGLAGGGGAQIAPQSRLARAYSQGYCDKRNGLASANPHTAPSDAASAYSQGFSDRTSAYPSTHVGGA